jgi:hypothetical protein
VRERVGDVRMEGKMSAVVFREVWTGDRARREATVGLEAAEVFRVRPTVLRRVREGGRLDGLAPFFGGEVAGGFGRGRVLLRETDG